MTEHVNKDHADDEVKSVASVEKAAEVTKKSPKRKGDKDAKDEPSAQGAGNTVPESVELTDTDFSDDLHALVDSEATLSEGFKEKAGVIFEAAIKSHVATEVERLEEEYAEQLELEVADKMAELEEKVGSYLNFVAEAFLEENKVAIHSNLRTEIAEGFISGMKELFTESYIEVPESKVDLVDELSEANAQLEADFDAAQDAAIQVSESKDAVIAEKNAELEMAHRKVAILEAKEGLTDIQADKLAELSENVDFVDAEDFTKKIATLKESYFSEKTASEVTTTLIEDTIEDTVAPSNSRVASYATFKP